MANKFVKFIKSNKNRIDILKSSFSITLGIVLIAALIYLAITLANATRKTVDTAIVAIGRVHSTMTVVNDGLENISQSFETLDTSLTTVKGYISEIEPIITSIKSIIGTELVGLAEKGRDSLRAAAQGSKIVDDTLKFLSEIPLLKFEYAPKKTLNESLLDLSETFGSLPESLSNLEQGLDTSSTDLETFEQKFSGLSTDISNMKTSISSTSVSINTFTERLETYQTTLPQTQRKIIIWISVLTVLLCLIVLLWMVSHIYTLILAHEELKSDRIAKRRQPET